MVNPPPLLWTEYVPTEYSTEYGLRSTPYGILGSATDYWRLSQLCTCVLSTEYNGLINSSTEYLVVTGLIIRQKAKDERGFTPMSADRYWLFTVLSYRHLGIRRRSR